MAKGKAKAVPGYEDKQREYQKRLLATLSPGGKYFSKQLGRILDEELDGFNSDASDAIKEFISRKHLKSMDSVQTVNRLAEERAEPHITACYMIMNYASLLVTSGRYHLSRGELDVTGSKLLHIWRIYARRLVDAGVTSQTQMDAIEDALTRKIGELGKVRSPSLFSMVKSMFVKQ